MGLKSPYSSQQRLVKQFTNTKGNGTEQPIPDTDEPIVAHIVKVGPGESAAANVLEARINGTPIEALCGHVWVPSRDPRQLPVCQACKETYDMFRIFNDGLRDSPSD